MCLYMLHCEDLILVKVHIEMIISRVYYIMMVHWLPYKSLSIADERKSHKD